MIIEKTPRAFRGRVMGFYSMSFGFIPLGAIPMGIISDLYGVNFAFIIAGITLILLTIVFSRKDIRQN